MVLKTTKLRKIVQSISHDKKFDDELMFSLEEEDTFASENNNITSPQNSTSGRMQKKEKSSAHFKMTCKNDKFVDISTLSWVPGGKVEKYLGNLNFCFIRETQNVRDYGGICGFVHSFITEVRK
jgi:hypothetical protein